MCTLTCELCLLSSVSDTKTYKAIHKISYQILLSIFVGVFLHWLDYISDTLKRGICNRLLPKKFNKTARLMLSHVFDLPRVFDLWSALCRKSDFTDWRICNRWDAGQGWPARWLAVGGCSSLGLSVCCSLNSLISKLFSIPTCTLLPFLRRLLVLTGNHDKVWAKLLMLTTATVM